jgi:hypothetical protein
MPWRCRGCCKEARSDCQRDGSRSWSCPCKLLFLSHRSATHRHFFWKCNNPCLIFHSRIACLWSVRRKLPKSWWQLWRILYWGSPFDWIFDSTRAPISKKPRGSPPTTSSTKFVALRTTFSDRGRPERPWSVSRWYRPNTMDGFSLSFNTFWRRWCTHRPSKTRPVYWASLGWKLVYACNYWAFWYREWIDSWSPWATWPRYPPWWYTWTRFQRLGCSAGL